MVACLNDMDFPVFNSALSNHNTGLGGFLYPISGEGLSTLGAGNVKI
jgi:hypothetical protein